MKPVCVGYITVEHTLSYLACVFVLCTYIYFAFLLSLMFERKQEPEARAAAKFVVLFAVIYLFCIRFSSSATCWRLMRFAFPWWMKLIYVAHKFQRLSRVNGSWDGWLMGEVSRSSAGIFFCIFIIVFPHYIPIVLTLCYIKIHECGMLWACLVILKRVFESKIMLEADWDLS